MADERDDFDAARDTNPGGSGAPQDQRPQQPPQTAQPPQTPASPWSQPEPTESYPSYGSTFGPGYSPQYTTPYGSTPGYNAPPSATPGYSAPAAPGYAAPSATPDYSAPSANPSYSAPSATPTVAYGSYGGGYPGGYDPFGYQGQPAAPAPPGGPSGPGGTDEPSGPGGGRRRIVVAAVVAAVIGGAVGGGIVAATDRSSNDTTIASGVSVTTQTAQNTARIDGTVTAAAAKIGPSVVTINVVGQSEAGTGSGLVLRSDGYILTNNHVVDVASGGGQIQVVTRDGQSATASVVGVDVSDDLAVIKVSGLTNLAAATFAKSSDLVVGQSVVAVGAPLGLSNTVTSGIVSDLARPVQTGDPNSSGSTADSPVFDAIQTDAAINPGNSGGPLVDLNGNVVGINAAIATADTGGVSVPGQTSQSGSIGIGFAIPSDEASRIAAELIATGKATHAIIGVSVDSSNASQSPIQTSVGATIAQVQANSPAATAGLQVGDVVTKVNSQLITQNIDLIAAIRSYAPEQTVTLTFVRSGATKTVQVKLGTAAS